MAQRGATIGFDGDDLAPAQAELAAARDKAEQAGLVVGANSLQRLEYVAPKFPASTRNRNMSGWVELEFTVKTDGSIDDIVVTNSSPRKTSTRPRPTRCANGATNR